MVQFFIPVRLRGFSWSPQNTKTWPYFSWPVSSATPIMFLALCSGNLMFAFSFTRTDKIESLYWRYKFLSLNAQCLPSPPTISLSLRRWPIKIPVVGTANPLTCLVFEFGSQQTWAENVAARRGAVLLQAWFAYNRHRVQFLPCLRERENGKWHCICICTYWMGRAYTVCNLV